MHTFSICYGIWDPFTQMRVRGDLVFMCSLTSRQVLHLYMTVYSTYSTARHANLCLSLAHPGRSWGLPDKQSYIEIFNTSQRLDQGVNAQCLGCAGWRQEWKKGKMNGKKTGRKQDR